MIANRINAHLIIKDPSSAVLEAKETLKKFPSSKSLWIAYIGALAADHQEKMMLQAWKDFISLYPEEKENREIIETLTWGIIGTASESSLPLVRVTSLLGAAFSQDAKGVALLKTALQDQNNMIRAIAVKLSTNMRDQSLQDEILKLFYENKSPIVRMEVIRAVGGLGMKKALPNLYAIASDPLSTDEEKAVAVESIVTLMDTVDRDSVNRLCQSNRSGMRLLACQAVSYFNLTEEVDLIIPLLNDSNFEVRAAAIRTFGTLMPRPQKVEEQNISEIVKKLALENDDKLSVIASWLLTLYDPNAGLIAFEKCFRSKSDDLSRFASSALASVGEVGLGLMLRLIKTHPDPFVKMNLALGLIRVRRECVLSCEILFKGLQEDNGRWMFQDMFGFKVLMPSDVSYNDRRLEDPETINQVTRLEILNLLAIMRFPHTLDAIKQFLKESQAGVTGIASSLLLTEGDEEAVELIENLLQDKDRDVRIQAALVLAMWGQNEKALKILQQEYYGVNREMKERILEGIANIRSKSNIPFLLERIEEPYQTIRLIAAAALLITLNH